MVVYKFLLFYFLAYCCSLSADGSQMAFTSSLASIQPSLTRAMTLTCELHDTVTTTPGGGLVGRGVTSTAGDLHILTSMVILRGNTHHVAKVTMKTLAEALLDLNNTHVTGIITGTSGLRGRLHMTVDFPTRSQSGTYTCHANGVNDLGDVVTLSQDVDIAIADPTINEIVQYIHNLTIDNINLELTINNQIAATLEQLHMIQNQTIIIQDQGQEIKDLKTKLQFVQYTAAKNTSELASRFSHVESGTVGTGNTNNWPIKGSVRQTQKYVKFTRAFVNAPVVHLAPAHLRVWERHGLDYTISLVHVDTQGFTFACSMINNAGYYIDSLTVSWLSVPQ